VSRGKEALDAGDNLLTAFKKNQSIRAFKRCQVGGGDGIRNIPEKNISAIPKKMHNYFYRKHPPQPRSI
jgi:hypothetical protein